MPIITLCADDFGLNRAVDEAVLDLIAMQRLNAISCMSVGLSFEASAACLLENVKANLPEAQIGLHLTFSEYEPLGDMPRLAPGGVFPSLRSIFLKSHLGLVDGAEIRSEILRQWQRFVDLTGRRPDFIDGHQHVHLLPIIRRQVIELAGSLLAEGGWVRSCHNASLTVTKNNPGMARAAVIASLSKRLAPRFEKAGLKTNQRFYGINDFSQDQDFGELMRGWMKKAAKASPGDSSVIMCHPGKDEMKDDPAWDPIASRRIDEYTYLASAQFVADLKAANLKLSPS